MDENNIEAGLHLLQARFPGARIQLVSQAHNVVYMVSLADGQHIAARFSWLGRPIAWTNAEAEWLSHLRDYHTLPVPLPLSVPEVVEAAGQTGTLLLMRWIDGQRLSSGTVSPLIAQDAAWLLVRVHRALETFPTERRRALERPLLDADGLRGLGVSQYAIDPEGERLLAPYADILAEVARQTQEALAVLDATGAQRIMIHGDFRPENLLETPRGLALIDFDDCAWGYAAYDLATFLMFTRRVPQAHAIRMALWQMYQGMSGAPDAWEPVLDTLMLTRFALSMRWAVNNRAHASIGNKIETLLAERAALIGFGLDGRPW